MFSSTISTEMQDTVKRFRPIAELIPTHWTQDTITANGIRQHFCGTA